MVSDGVVGVLPEYLLGSVLELIVVMPPKTFLVHDTDVMAKFEVTEQTSVTACP